MTRIEITKQDKNYKFTKKLKIFDFEKVENLKLQISKLQFTKKIITSLLVFYS